MGLPVQASAALTDVEVKTKSTCKDKGCSSH
jgi:hypothetical protein